jgi:hypothetical protein
MMMMDDNDTDGEKDDDADGDNGNDDDGYDNDDHMKRSVLLNIPASTSSRHVSLVISRDLLRKQHINVQ